MRVNRRLFPPVLALAALAASHLGGAEPKQPETKKAPGPGSRWSARYDRSATAEMFTVTPGADGVEVATSKAPHETEETHVSLLYRLEHPAAGLTFTLTATGSAARMPIALYDAAANELWRHDGRGAPPPAVRLDSLRVRGQVIFRIRRPPATAGAASGTLRIGGLAFTPLAQKPKVGSDGFTVVDTLDELRGYANQPLAKVRLKPGVYTLDRALFRAFIELTGRDSQWDLRGVTVRVDTRLFQRFGSGPASPGPGYSAFTVSGSRIRIEGLKVETFGDQPGVTVRNALVNVTGSGAMLRALDLTTAGCSLWGYGNLFGSSGPDLHALDGIRLGWPARDVAVVGCRVRVRALGHGILVQGAHNSLIQDCHIDGLLRPTNEVLAEKSGPAFDRKFIARGRNYSEGVTLGPDGRILPDEMIALGEDGIRLVEQAGADRPTGDTKIIGCTVTRMRRGICTAFGPGGDLVLNCVVRECVAAGFSIGAGDVVRSGRADARYAEAVALPAPTSSGAEVDVEILDSRGGRANPLLAVINGESHRVTLRTAEADFVPPGHAVELASRRGLAHGMRAEPVAKGVILVNETPASVQLRAGATDNEVASRGRVAPGNRGSAANKIRKL